METNVEVLKSTARDSFIVQRASLEQALSAWVTNVNKLPKEQIDALNPDELDLKVLMPQLYVDFEAIDHKRLQAEYATFEELIEKRNVYVREHNAYTAKQVAAYKEAGIL